MALVLSGFDIDVTSFIVAVVIFTGYPTLETAVQSMKLDAVDYLKKPFNVDDLLRIIDTIGAGGGKRTKTPAPAPKPAPRS